MYFWILVILFSAITGYGISHEIAAKKFFWLVFFIIFFFMLGGSCFVLSFPIGTPKFIIGIIGACFWLTISAIVISVLIWLVKKSKSRKRILTPEQRAAAFKRAYDQWQKEHELWKKEHELWQIQHDGWEKRHQEWEERVVQGSNEEEEEEPEEPDEPQEPCLVTE